MTNVSEVLANEILMREVRKHFNPHNAIKCSCVKCGGEGYAMDDSMLDAKGFLKGMLCPCGGAIRKQS